MGVTKKSNCPGTSRPLWACLLPIAVYVSCAPIIREDSRSKYFLRPGFPDSWRLGRYMFVYRLVWRWSGWSWGGCWSSRIGGRSADVKTAQLTHNNIKRRVSSISRDAMPFRLVRDGQQWNWDAKQKPTAKLNWWLGSYTALYPRVFRRGPGGTY
jgi:hypothetical protein